MKQTLHSFLPWIAAFFACCAIAFGIYPQLIPYHQTIFMVAGLNIILAVSLTLTNGFTGQFSLGHAGFMAVGGYTTATLMQVLFPKLGGPQEIQLLLSLLGGGMLAAVFGYLVGLPSLRLKGDYLAVVTLGFSEIIRVILLNVDSLGGARGLSGIAVLTNQNWMTFSAFLCTFTVIRLLGTPSGRAMLAVREDEVAAEAMGVDTTRTKVRAFVMGAFWAGVAGGLYAHQYGYLSPGNFNFMKSFDAVVIVVLGGLGSVSGAILAAIGLSILPEALRPLQKLTGLDFRMIIYSLILILFMLLKPNGLLGKHELKHYWQRWRGRKS